MAFHLVEALHINTRWTSPKAESIGAGGREREHHAQHGRAQTLLLHLVYPGGATRERQEDDVSNAQQAAVVMAQQHGRGSWSAQPVTTR
jgi:hypothetical protein